MPRSQRRLLLLAPGLLGPVADPDAVSSLQAAVPPLEDLLRRSERLEEVYRGRFEAAVFGAFGVGGRELPVAAVSRFGEADGDTAHVGESGWLRADPVHLRIDTHSARLFGDYVLRLEPGEAGQLVERLNGHFAADGLRFEAPAPGRWYIAVEDEPRLETYPPHAVAGRNIDAFMPQGDDAGRWRNWMNEAQMLLHDAAVNDQREHRGALPVNSVWPWGGGRLPPQPLETVPAMVHADDPLTLGLARLAGIAAQPLAVPLDEREPAAGQTLIVTTEALEPLVHGDFGAWLEAVERVAGQWLAPAQRQLAEGHLESIQLAVDGGSRYRLRGRGRWRPWRRRRPWTDWLEAG